MDLRSQSDVRELFPVLLQMTRHVRQRVNEKYAIIGMNETRAGILEKLGNQSANISQKELALELCLSESNICGLVERMRKEGLIERCRSMIDRRKSILRLTEVGVEKLQEVLDLHDSCEQELTRNFTSQELHLHVAVLESIFQSLSAENDQQTRRVA